MQMRRRVSDSKRSDSSPSSPSTEKSTEQDDNDLDESTRSARSSSSNSAARSSKVRNTATDQVNPRSIKIIEDQSRLIRSIKINPINHDQSNQSIQPAGGGWGSMDPATAHVTHVRPV